MIVFHPNRPITTTRSEVEVDAGLRPGRYRFRLVVIDDEGNKSLPSEQIITIRDQRRRQPLEPVEPSAPSSIEPSPSQGATADLDRPWWRRLIG